MYNIPKSNSTGNINDLSVLSATSVSILPGLARKESLTKLRAKMGDRKSSISKSKSLTQSKSMNDLTTLNDVSNQDTDLSYQSDKSRSTTPSMSMPASPIPIPRSATPRLDILSPRPTRTDFTNSRPISPTDDYDMVLPRKLKPISAWSSSETKKMIDNMETISDHLSESPDTSSDTKLRMAQHFKSIKSDDDVDIDINGETESNTIFIKRKKSDGEDMSDVENLEKTSSTLNTTTDLTGMADLTDMTDIEYEKASFDEFFSKSKLGLFQAELTETRKRLDEILSSNIKETKTKIGVLKAFKMGRH